MADIRILGHAHVGHKKLEDIEGNYALHRFDRVFEDKVLYKFDDETQHGRDLFVEHVSNLVVLLLVPTKLIHEVGAVPQD